MSKWALFVRGALKENPILAMMLGLCPVLAMTSTVRDGLALGILTSTVLVSSNIIIAVLGHVIPSRAKFPVAIIVIATLVTVVDYLVQAFQPSLSNSLSIFVPLIAANCLVLTKAQDFAGRNSATQSLVNSLGMAIGFTFVIFLVAAIREIIGQGTFFGLSLLGSNFAKSPVTLLALPPGAFVVIALLTALYNKFIRR